MNVFLRDGDDVTLAELSRGFTEVRPEPGTTLWKAGDPAGFVSLLVSGEVTCLQVVNGVALVGGIVTNVRGGTTPATGMGGEGPRDRARRRGHRPQRLHRIYPHRPPCG